MSGRAGVRWLVAVLVATGLAACSTQVDGDGTAAAGVGESPSDGPTGPEPSDDPTDPDPPDDPGGGDCPGSDVENTGNDLDESVLAESPSGLAPYASFMGPMDLARVVNENFPDEDMATARQVFSDAGFVAGHENAWAEGILGEPGSMLENAAVFEFETAQGVCDVLDWHKSYYDYEDQTELTQPGVVGAVFQPQDGSFSSVEYLAPKGNRIAYVFVSRRGSADLSDRAAEILDGQYEVT